MYAGALEKGSQADKVDEYHSVIPRVVLNLVIPLTGLAGLCAVVPTGIVKAPVELNTTFCNVSTVIALVPLVCNAKTPLESALVLSPAEPETTPLSAFMFDAMIVPYEM